MNRPPLPSPPTAHKPLINILVALSLAGFIAVLGAFGRATLGVVFVLWCVGLGYWGHHWRQKQLREVEAERARVLKAHVATRAERMLFAQREGAEYEDASAETAEGFGRIPQELPNRFLLPEEKVLAGHAASLLAQGVLRMNVDGFPVTVFDLEAIDEVGVDLLKKYCKYDRAAEATKDYLTVCAVTLPMRLPYVASAHLFRKESSDLDRTTTDQEFAKFLLSRPAVREHATDRDWLWSVDEDRLIACAVTSTGLDLPSVRELAARTAGAARAFPWPELERFRLPDPEPGARPSHTLWVNLPYQHRHQDSLLSSLALLWEERELGRSGLRAFQARNNALNEVPTPEPSV